MEFSPQRAAMFVPDGYTRNPSYRKQFVPHARLQEGCEITKRIDEIGV